MQFKRLHIPFALLMLLFFTPEIVNSFTRSWYQKAPFGGEARHRCTGFSIGNKGYIGGGHVNSGEVITYKDYWEYDPASDSWTQIADYGGGLRYHSSAFTIGDAAYVGCGENATHDYTNDFWKYVPEVNTWFEIASLPGQERRGAVAFTINDFGYCGTGQSDLGYHTDFFKYDPTANTWENVAEFPGEPRSAAVSFALEDKGYVGTGHMVGAALNDFWCYSAATDSWEEKTPVGGSIRQDAMAFCIDGKGYIGTGNDNLGNDFKDIWEYDFTNDTWTQIEDFGGEKRRYAVTFVIDPVAYLGSGTDGTNFRDFWAYAPTVSIAEDQLPKIEVACFPNPSSSLMHIVLEHNNNSRFFYTLHTLSGQTVKAGEFTEKELTLEKQQLNSGSYILSIYNDHFAKIASKKITFN